MLQYHHYINLLDRFCSYTTFSDDFDTVMISFLGIRSFSFFLISQNQSAAGNVIQLNKKNKPHMILDQVLYISEISVPEFVTQRF